MTFTSPSIYWWNLKRSLVSVSHSAGAVHNTSLPRTIQLAYIVLALRLTGFSYFFNFDLMGSPLSSSFLFGDVSIFWTHKYISPLNTGRGHWLLPQLSPLCLESCLRCLTHRKIDISQYVSTPTTITRSFLPMHLHFFLLLEVARDRMILFWVDIYPFLFGLCSFQLPVRPEENLKDG